MGMVKLAAAIMEYNAWALSMGHKYRERVCSSFAGKRNERSALNDSMLDSSRCCFSCLYQ